ncbi:PREDICTED: double-stranded RNA-binding protein 4-like [Camelina sativa]|uniref:Double-stranded RNA-binding protein 4-like n=1 Tax=Camelina sativa TaxID=90675 RepID=A0ABM1R4W5_CAMSA|nr:PREDICTED: double-stranded RNA-binding protein 4-like [Camelina sativa]XP_019094053.1 PREDICTED: double-stranded RNA-binding protein 4-like [Camelina sativa]
MDHVYKGQLQAYALKQNLELPAYVTEREGAPHAPRFRSKVTFCGQTFQSHEFFPTLKSAEHAAAKIALASLTPQSPEGIDVAYKNLLQEIAQKGNSLLPVYATVTSGPSHLPVFTSTVEFAGKVFSGEEAKTKKLAETSAAKVAFMSIKTGNSNQTSWPSLPCERQEAVNSNVKSILQEIQSQPSQVVMTPEAPAKCINVDENEFPDLHNAPASNAKERNVALRVPKNPTNDGTLNAPTSDSMKMKIAASSSPIPQNPTNLVARNAPATNGIKRNIAACTLRMPQNPTNDGRELSPCVCVDESEKKKLIMGTGHLSIPTGQHVFCRPWNPEITLPQDAEMLFRDDSFIAYRVMKP